MLPFYVCIEGGKKYFDTIENAVIYCNEVFNKTGIVLCIFRTEDK